MTSQIQASWRRAIERWPRRREKVRYLFVGGWNTLVWYGSFALFYYLLRERLAIPVILALAYLIASVNGYLGFRYLVFTPVRHPVPEFLRYQAVYLPILAANMIAVPLAVSYTTLSAYVAQPLVSVVAFIVAYFGNKYFAFRKRPERE